MTDLAPPGTMDDTNRAAAADLLLQAAALEAKGLSDPADVLAAARLILERAYLGGACSIGGHSY